MNRLAGCGAVVALTTPLMTHSASVAHASSLTTGDATFFGDANLSTFPCPPPPPFGNGTGPCPGQFNGQWAGNLNGVANSQPFTVSWTTATESLSAPRV